MERAEILQLDQEGIEVSPRASQAVGATAQPAVIRCAVYTRVSTDEGLGQEFTTLDNQREACES